MVILDEPTANLSHMATEALLKTMLELKSHGVASQKVPLAIIGGALLVSAAVGAVSYLISSSMMESGRRGRP